VDHDEALVVLLERRRLRLQLTEETVSGQRKRAEAGRMFHKVSAVANAPHSDGPFYSGILVIVSVSATEP
jgi:hypothetical protein